MHCSGNVYVWDTEARLLKQVAASGFKPRAAAFSSGPVNDDGAYHVAIGGTKGEIKVPMCVCVCVCVYESLMWILLSRQLQVCMCVWLFCGCGCGCGCGGGGVM